MASWALEKHHCQILLAKKSCIGFLVLVLPFLYKYFCQWEGNATCSEGKYFVPVSRQDFFLPKISVKLSHRQKIYFAESKIPLKCTAMCSDIITSVRHLGSLDIQSHLLWYLLHNCLVLWIWFPVWGVLHWNN